MNLAKRNPVAVRAAIVAAATAAAHVAVVFGLLDSVHAAALVDAVGPMVDLVGLVVLVAWARAGVTPNAKVLTRVTTDGGMVAGEAAALPTGAPLVVTPRGRTVEAATGRVVFPAEELVDRAKVTTGEPAAD